VLVEGRYCKTMAFKIPLTSMFLIEVLVLVSLVCLPLISVTDLGYVYLQMFTVNLLLSASDNS